MKNVNETDDAVKYMYMFMHKFFQHFESMNI